jgi:hypothetical protein
MKVGDSSTNQGQATSDQQAGANQVQAAADMTTFASSATVIADHSATSGDSKASTDETIVALDSTSPDSNATSVGTIATSDSTASSDSTTSGTIGANDATTGKADATTDRTIVSTDSASGDQHTTSRGKASDDTRGDANATTDGTIASTDSASGDEHTTSGGTISHAAKGDGSATTGGAIVSTDSTSADQNTTAGETVGAADATTGDATGGTIVGTDSTSGDSNATSGGTLGGSDATTGAASSNLDAGLANVDAVSVNPQPVTISDTSVIPIGGQIATIINASSSGSNQQTGHAGATSQNGQSLASDPLADVKQAAQDRSRLLLEQALSSARTADLLTEATDAWRNGNAEARPAQEQAAIVNHNQGCLSAGEAGHGRLEDYLESARAAAVLLPVSAGSYDEVQVIRREGAPPAADESLDDSNPQGADLIAGLYASEQTLLDSGLDDFVRQIATLGQQLGRSMEGLGAAPWMMTLAMSATAYEVCRRHKGSRRPGQAGDGSTTLTWFGGLPGSLSTEHA